MKAWLRPTPYAILAAAAGGFWLLLQTYIQGVAPIGTSNIGPMKHPAVVKEAPSVRLQLVHKWVFVFEAVAQEA